MANTCVLTVLPVIPHWRIYNLPSKKSIQYCLMLKQKREFTCLIENALIQRPLKNISCCVVDKYLSKNSKTFEVIFLEDAAKIDLISLSITVIEKHMLKRLNNLLVFLKNSEKDVRFQIRGGNIYVKCDTFVRWNIFYKLYEFLLLKFSHTCIGTVFYCAIISNYIITLEKIFLLVSSSNDGSCSPFISICNIKKSRLKSLTGSKKLNRIEIKKKVLPPLQKSFKYSKKHFGDELKCKKYVSSVLHKRKTLNDEKFIFFDAPAQKVQKLKHCSCAKINCKCHESNWKLYKNISKTSIKSYTDILLSKSNLSLTEQFSSQDSNLSLTSESFITSKFNNLVSDHSENLAKCIQSFPDVKIKETNAIGKCINQDISKNKAIVLENKNLKEQPELKPDKEFILKFDSKQDPINIFPVREGKENLSNLFNDFIEDVKACKTSVSFDLFRTASGKKVNVSNSALKAAEKMLVEAHLTENLPSSQNSSIPAKNTATKYFNESIDGVLAEQMFEDISFDEKEFSPVDSIVQSSLTFSERVTDGTSSAGKVRKSLGGRRSLKPYSAPKL